jgi:tetratricopeptide (TPR) repeat protein
MLYDLRDKLEPIGRLDVLDDVAKKAKEYLDQLPKELVTPSRLDQQAVMFNNLGDVLVAQGKLQEALEAYQQSLKTQQTLAEQDKRCAASRFGESRGRAGIYYSGYEAARGGDADGIHGAALVLFVSFSKPIYLAYPPAESGAALRIHPPTMATADTFTSSDYHPLER